MMLRKTFLSKMELLLRNAIAARMGLPNWYIQTKDSLGRKMRIRRLSGKDNNDKEHEESKVHEYLKRAPSMQQRSQKQIKELRDIRVELIKERKILQRRLKENEKKIIQEKRKRTPNDNNAITKYIYKLKMTRRAPKAINVQVVRRSDGKVMQFQEFIQSFGKSLTNEENSGKNIVQNYNLIETALSKDQTPPSHPKSPIGGKNLTSDGNSSQKNTVGFVQTIQAKDSNETVAAASNKNSKETPSNTKSKTNVDPKAEKETSKGRGKSADTLKPNQVISTVTKRDTKDEIFKKARAARNRKLKKTDEGEPETSQLASKSEESKQNKETTKKKFFSINFDSRKKTEKPVKNPITLTPNKSNSQDNVDKNEPKGKSESKILLKKKSKKKVIKIPIPTRPYDVLTQAIKLKKPQKIESEKKSISKDSKDPDVHDDTPYSRLHLDPRTQFQAYVDKIQQQQTPLRKGKAEPTQASSLNASISNSQSKLDLEKHSANRKNSDHKIPSKILEQLKYVEIRNQNVREKDIKDQLKREFENPKTKNNNSINNVSNTTKKELDLNSGESVIEDASSKRNSTERCVKNIELSAQMFLKSLEQFVQSLKTNNNNNDNNNNNNNNNKDNKNNKNEKN